MACTWSVKEFGRAYLCGNLLLNMHSTDIVMSLGGNPDQSYKWQLTLKLIDEGADNECVCLEYILVEWPPWCRDHLHMNMRVEYEMSKGNQNVFTLENHHRN